MEKIKGSDIVMIGSMYNNNSLIVYTRDGSEYRMRGDDILPVIKKFNYTSKKAKVHSYLSVDEK